MFKVLIASVLLTGFSSMAAEQTLPPPPSTNPTPVEKLMMKCEVTQYNLECAESSAGDRICRVGPSVSAQPVLVTLASLQQGQLVVRSTLNGQSKVVYQSVAPMTCDLPNYTCESANRSEAIAFVMNPSREYGTQDFTLWRKVPNSSYIFSVGATAKVACVAVQ